MFGPSVTLRCAHCGGYLSSPTPPGAVPAWTSCPTCGRPVPVLRPRDPPPLFTWEAFPQIYPSPTPPRWVGPRVQAWAVALLAAVVVLLAIVAGGFLLQGGQALYGPEYTIAGHVTGAPATGGPPGPIAGASVNVTGEGGFQDIVETGLDGAFTVPGVPTGGITLNITATGYAPLRVDLFASPGYTGTVHDLGDLRLVLSPGEPGQGTTLVDTDFATLEVFLAILFSGSSLLGLAAVIALVGLLKERRGHDAWGVVGGMAGGLAPVALLELGVTSLSPVLTALSAVAGALGFGAVVLAAALLAAQERPEPPEAPVT